MVWSLTYSQTSWSMTSSSGSITANKASGGDGIPAEPFQILKDNAVKDDAFYMAANLENSAVAIGLEKVNFSFQSQRKAMPKNVPTTVQLCSFHMLAK